MGCPFAPFTFAILGMLGFFISKPGVAFLAMWERFRPRKRRAYAGRNAELRERWLEMRGQRATAEG